MRNYKETPYGIGHDSGFKTFDFEDDNQPVAFGLMGNEKVRVRVAFFGWAAPYVSERIWGADQVVDKGEDDAVFLAFSTGSTDEVISWVMSFGPYAELLEPKALREELIEELEETAEIYE